MDKRRTKVTAKPKSEQHKYEDEREQISYCKCFQAVEAIALVIKISLMRMQHCETIGPYVYAYGFLISIAGRIQPMMKFVSCFIHVPSRAILYPYLGEVVIWSQPWRASGTISDVAGSVTNVQTILGRAGYDLENGEVKSGQHGVEVAAITETKTVLGRAGYDLENEEVKSGMVNMAVNKQWLISKLHSSFGDVEQLRIFEKLTWWIDATYRLVNNAGISLAYKLENSSAMSLRIIPSVMATMRKPELQRLELCICIGK
nr:hypothetical protein [Tanacetum cinerariifolium]